MKEELDNTKEAALSEIKNARTKDELENVRIKYLGRKGEMAGIISRIPSMPQEEKPTMGRLANEIKQLLIEEIAKKKNEIIQLKVPPAERMDLTMPGYSFQIGHIHPITRALNEICEIFTRMGFAVVEGPEIETEYNNFEALNIPLEHPSRDIFDTFYIRDNLLLRSHTSPVQIRYMKKHSPPFAIVVPGKVFRPDAVDASHSFMFHQVEGLMIAEGISFAHLKGVLLDFGRQLFGEEIRLRFRPHFFPFTEPSAEVDVSCIICKGKGCRVCSQKGWLEILGAGMVDPAVFKAVNLTDEKFTGFAFGMGVERIAMLKYGINDIRLFFENDVRFLEQF
ncbi:MAG: phenylalanine--tRNA ligase subunit alpha [Candidatus Omnitrophota bacterium]|nr:MAG: phenylalanine--tRNA ligase subunit alpha [Candidatus Omnitrophota bacterium]